MISVNIWDVKMVYMLLAMMLAVVLGGSIGLERSLRGRSAGFRTYSLVALASAAIVSLAYFITANEMQGDNAVTLLSPNLNNASTNFLITPVMLLDPASRMIQGLLSGMGFLGAGVIIREGLSVKGLTSAAALWLTSAIGILCGFQLFLPAIFLTALALMILTLFRHLEALLPQDQYLKLEIVLEQAQQLEEVEIRQWLNQNGCELIEIAFAKKKEKLHFECYLRYQEKAAPSKLAQFLQQQERVGQFYLSSSLSEKQ